MTDWKPPEDAVDRAALGFSRHRLRLLGDLAVARGFLTPGQLDHWMRKLEEEAAPALQTSPADYLVAKGILTREQADEIRRELELGTPGLVPLAPAGEIPAGSSFARYEVLEKVGEGGMGVVYRARDRQLGREVALKILRESAADHPVARQRFEQEAQASARLSHPNVVAVHDVGQEAGRLFFVMELIDGESFGALISAGGSDRRRLVRLLERVARGIHHAHEHDIVHRDLKPANILVTRQGEPKVADFGVAHIAGTGTGLTKTGSTVGTPAYMAPEQVHGKVREITPRTDVYAIGAILYQILAGRPPHSGDSVGEIYTRIVNEDPVPPRKLDRTAPADLETVAMKALEKDPARRYPSAAAFADDLARWLEGEPVSARPVSRTVRALRKGFRNARLLAAATAALLVAAGFAAWAYSLRREASDRDRQARDKQEAFTLLEKGRAPLDQAARALYRKDSDLAALRRDVEAARSLLQRATELAPDLAPAQLLLGRAWELLGWEDRAEAAWRAAVAADPSFAPARLQLGRLLLRRAAFLRTFLNPGEDPAASTAAAEALVSDAASQVAAALKAGTLEGDLDRDLAEAMLLLTQGRPDEAFAKAEDAATRFRGREGVEEFHAVAALARIAVGGDARDLLDQAIDIRPKFPFARTVRGWIRQEAGDAAGAGEDYGVALEVNPRLHVAWVNRGVVRLRGGDPAGAAGDFDRALDLDPHSLPALVNRGLCRYDLGDVDAAIRDYDAAIARHPQSLSARFERARAALKKRDHDAADLHASEAIRLSAGKVGLGLRVDARYEKRNYAGTIEDATAMIQADPGDLNAYWYRGRARASLGDFRGGVADLEEALRIAPPTWGLRGLVEQRVADWKRTIEGNEH